MPPLPRQDIVTPLAAKAITQEQLQPFLAGVGGNVDLARSKAAFELAKAPTTPTVPKPVASPVTNVSEEGVVGDTSGIRDNMVENKSDASKLLDDLGTAQDLASTDLQGRLKGLDTLLEESRTLGEIDLNKIEEAGAAAGRAFDPLIDQAREAGRQGLAKATVGGGERGGFESTQIAGQAALTPTEGGTFVGAGGELSKIKGQLDQNISRLETARLNAMSAARVAAEKAVRTGKQSDLKIAGDIMSRAQDAFEIEQNMISKRIDTLAKIEEIKQAQIGTQDATQQQAMQKIQQLGTLGTEIADEDLLTLEKDAGLPAGTGRQIIEASRLAGQAETEQEQLDSIEQIVGVLSKIPSGTEIQIGDSTYTGLKQGANRIFKEEDRFGNVTFVTLDDKGSIINVETGGQIGKGFKGFTSGPTSTPGPTPQKQITQQEIGQPTGNEVIDRNVDNVLALIEENKNLGLNDKEMVDDLVETFDLDPASAQRILQINK